MQDFLDNEKKRVKMAVGRPFWILILRKLSWVILVKPYIFVFIHGVDISHCFMSYVNITKLLKNGHFEIACSQKADIAEHKKSDRNFT